MCGRYTIVGDVDRYATYFGVDEIRGPSLEPSYNVAPTDTVYGVVESDGTRLLGTFTWGLLPFWARDRRSIHINARAETIAEKAAFREALAKRRCIIPADGFYEWEKLPHAKLPHYIQLASGEPMAFAGIWSRWRNEKTGDTLSTCAIVTTQPNDLIRPLHDRMPVVLNTDGWTDWLDPPSDDPIGLMAMLRPSPAQAMVEYPVSTLVNSVDNNVAELITPLS